MRKRMKILLENRIRQAFHEIAGIADMQLQAAFASIIRQLLQQAATPVMKYSAATMPASGCAAFSRARCSPPPS